ncbi:J domain-containing protein [Rufibacter quisquiliarum]|uniref:Regulator of protease activity HflC (Stomatin/prohibitin superfamily) n=1 Tax=Rufibacter quisquiliarum TaxID=1549639 RepID=A0A839G7I3_9BACT|nr:J domain-containing protein [Rufibacter quisquiliarum]MBA9075384.1 regulator of protease activity HflC (stomatin/prohibitin superfamily) [Rufibacter quisquiliarum]
MAKTKPAQDTLLPQIQQKEKASLSKLQQQFNSKVKKIDKLKADLAERVRVLDEIRARVQQEIHPLVQELVQQRVAYVKMLDQMCGQDFFRKKEKEKLGYLIEDLSYSLIHTYGVEEMKEYFDKYAETTFEEEEELADAEAKEMTQTLLKNLLGLDVDLKDLDDFGTLQEKLEGQMREEQQKREAQQKKRQKTKAQLAKEEKAKTELQNISKATRRLYTDLVKLLHPDKEQDPAAKAWKEEAMKKVTTAYNQDDFFELLRLQMEFMHEQELHLDRIPEEQLKYFVKLLNEQIRELQEEQSSYFYGPDAQLFYQFGGLPKQMEAKFNRAKKEIQAEIKQLQLDTLEFQDPQFLRQYLKDLKF